MHNLILGQVNIVHWGVIDMYGDQFEGFGDYQHTWNIHT